MQQQDRKRQVQLFKVATGFYETSAGVKVQRIMGSELLRIMRPWLKARSDAEKQGKDSDALDPRDFAPDSDDLVVQTIYNLKTLWPECAKKNVLLFYSIEALAEIYAEHKARSNAALFLAWAVEGGRVRCVGGLTVCRAYARPDLGTSDDVISDADAGVLKPYMKKEPLFIDGVCSTSPGVGTALTVHAVRWALMRNHAGVLLLSFSSKPLRAPRMPESHRMFEKLFFETIIPQARFKPPHNRHYHGSWMYLPLASVPLYRLLEQGVQVCGRKAVNDKNRIVARCPL